jgi:hypothetical protein
VPARTALLVVVLVAAGCASLPEGPDDDGLLASSAVVAARPLETGDRVEVGLFSAASPGGGLPSGWEPYRVLAHKNDTRYRLVEDAGVVVLEADADRSASGVVREIRIDPQRHPVIEWRWRVPALIDGADPRVATREDAPARILVAFHGDAQKLDMFERSTLRLAKAISGTAMPYATLVYLWADKVPSETVVRNLHTGRVRMIVVESGAGRLGRWITVRRNLVEDDARAFGEAPGDIVGIGVMTDTDNTRSRARAYYGDITVYAAP